MGRGKHCTPEKRKIIQNLLLNGKTYAEIRKIVGCSNKMIRNAKIFCPKQETRGRKQAMTGREVHKLVRASKKNPFAPATELKRELQIVASVETVRRRLRNNHLDARSPRKVPLLTKKHVAKRLKFAKDHMQWPASKWRNILWTDESKIVLYGASGSRSFVRRPPNCEYVPKYTKKTIKHGGSSIMIWACFSYYGVGPIHWIRTIMDQHVYVKILEEIMLPYATDEMPLKWVFQQDNDPKHTSQKAKKWFEENKIEVMEWPPQSPDLNPIENLWAGVKTEVVKSNPKNVNELWVVVERSWKTISIETCQKLIDSMPARCSAVLANNGHATKY